MATNKKTTWDASNLVIEKDYNTRFNEVIVGNPELTIEKPTTTDGDPVLTFSTWYKFQCEETARFKYIGMDYTTAKSCELSLLNGLTFNVPTWEYGPYLSDGKFLFGYHSGNSAPQLHSNVVIEKCDNTDMYNVVVDAKVDSEAFSNSPNLFGSLGTRLKAYLNSLSGWRTYPSGWSNGKQQNAASANNIVLLRPPTVTRKFDLVGFDILKMTYNDLSGFTTPAWYKYTDKYVCQIQYTGMTRTACTTLFNSLNNTAGWYYSYHPWEYVVDYTNNTFKWQEMTSITTYQCLNDFRAIKSDGNMWTAELDLCVEKIGYTLNTSSPPPYSWPTVWNRIPGLSQYL